MDEHNVMKGHNNLAIKIKEGKSEPLFGLDKIPVESLYKLALEQIGEQESYIEELEDRIKDLEKEKKTIRQEERVSLMREIQKEAVVEAKKQQYTESLLKKIAKQERKIKSLYESRNVLLNELMQNNVHIGIQEIKDEDGNTE